jgi:hypothetical protein
MILPILLILVASGVLNGLGLHPLIMLVIHLALIAAAFRNFHRVLNER